MNRLPEGVHATTGTSTHQASVVRTTLCVALMVKAAIDCAELEFGIFGDEVGAHHAFVPVMHVFSGRKQMTISAAKTWLLVQALMV